MEFVWLDYMVSPPTPTIELMIRYALNPPSICNFYNSYQNHGKLQTCIRDIYNSAPVTMPIFNYVYSEYTHFENFLPKNFKNPGQVDQVRRCFSKTSSFSLSFNWLSSFFSVGQALRSISLSNLIALVEEFRDKRSKASLSPWPPYKDKIAKLYILQHEHWKKVLYKVLWQNNYS